MPDLCKAVNPQTVGLVHVSVQKMTAGISARYEKTCVSPLQSSGSPDSWSRPCSCPGTDSRHLCKVGVKGGHGAPIIHDINSSVRDSTSSKVIMTFLRFSQGY